MNRHDYIPRAYVELENWLDAFQAYLDTRLPSFGLEPSNCAEFTAKKAVFIAANHKAESHNAGSADRVDRKEKAAAATKATRELVNRYLRYNSAVTDFDRTQMGLTVSNGKPTPAPVPHTVPGVNASLRGPGVVELHYYDSANADSKKRKKPDGVHGLEIRWALLNEPPENDWDKLVNQAFSTASPCRLTFPGTDRGKRLYFALRWENTRAQKGPLSNIYEIIVP